MIVISAFDSSDASLPTMTSRTRDLDPSHPIRRLPVAVEPSSNVAVTPPGLELNVRELLAELA